MGGGFIIVDVKNRKIVLIAAAVSVVLFLIGIGIGYASGAGGKNKARTKSDYSLAAAIRSSCRSTSSRSSTWQTYFKRYLERHSGRHVCVQKAEQCWDSGLPRNYIAYHLNGKSVNVDGRLNEQAWTEVPWSETFVDARSVIYPKPYFDTKFKMRWSNDEMFVGVYIQEKNLWATHVEHDAQVYKENGFEIFADVDGTMFNYKQVIINVLGTMMDQILYKSPWDAHGANVSSMSWHSGARKAIYADGTVNTPGDTDKSWTVEMALPFSNLSFNSTRTSNTPDNDEVWFMQFGRSEQKLIVKDGQYQKAPNSKTDWWSWQACDAVNFLLQDRWGLVQFKRNQNDNKFKFRKWHIYKALFDTMNALKRYQGVNGKYTTTVEELDLPPYLLSRTCVDIPNIRLTRRNQTLPGGKLQLIPDFEVTVKSMLINHAPAHIRSDRYVTFS